MIGYLLRPARKARLALALVSLPLCVATIRTLQALDITTTAGRTFKNVAISRTEPDGIVIIAPTGVIKLYFHELPANIQKKYGYDRAKAEAYQVAEARRRAQQERPAATPQVSSTESSSPAPVPLNASRPGPAPAANAEATADVGAGLVLDRSWEGPMQGGSGTRRDLARVLSPFAKPARNIGANPEVEIYDGVTYLMPLVAAKQKLRVAGKLAPKSLIVCPGFPPNSMFYHAIDGVFEGDYNRMLIVTDKADQVVSIDLLAEKPARLFQRGFHYWLNGDTNFLCYNFVVHRVKAQRDLRVFHELSYQVRDRWTRLADGASDRIDSVRADVVLVDRDVRPRHTGDSGYKILESSRWYIPRPLAELLLYNISRAGH